MKIQKEKSQLKPILMYSSSNPSSPQTAVNQSYVSPIKPLSAPLEPICSPNEWMLNIPVNKMKKDLSRPPFPIVYQAGVLERQPTFSMAFSIYSILTPLYSLCLSLSLALIRIENGSIHSSHLCFSSLLSHFVLNLQHSGVLHRSFVNEENQQKSESRQDARFSPGSCSPLFDGFYMFLCYFAEVEAESCPTLVPEDESIC